LLPEHLPQPIREYLPPSNGNGHLTSNETLEHSIDAVERNFIQKALERHGNSRARAAEALGISRVTLYKKMKKYGLMPANIRSTGQLT
jgi:transcriptional regulator with PAS, ATPase and Fis domain